MEANVFLSEIKASDGDGETDLAKAFQKYSVILANLPQKDRGTFSLNVLCVLCRNIDKVPSYRSSISHAMLLTLTIHCVRATRTLEKGDCIKALACIYHIHRCVVREGQQVPAELILKLSYMPFENDYDTLLHEYSKTYWNIIADRLQYIEKLKTTVNVSKLLPKLSEDICKVLQIYDTVPFCSNAIVFLVKKLHFLYSDVTPQELNKVFGNIFEVISSKNDLKAFKRLPDKDLLDFYAKFCDCLYVIAENTTKINFKNSVLSGVVRNIIVMLGHCPNILHCLQGIFLNSFCSLLTEKPNITYMETILNNMVLSWETAEKLGYSKTMLATYPFISQFMKLYLEYHISNYDKLKWKSFNAEILQSCLKIIYFVMKYMKNCSQVSKCENCDVKTGYHDALRLSFLTKHLLSISLTEKVQLQKSLPIFYDIAKLQYEILKELCLLNCNNYKKFLKKLQADIHNTAISLNKSSYNEFSIKLFNLYLQNEINNFKTETELKNISRALYNKSICELDCKEYEKALKNAYLSLIFSHDLTSEKYMSLVMDIKAKALKKDDDNDDENELQLMTVLDACVSSVENNDYGNLKPFFCNLKFSALLKHEFSMYAKLWPSIVPIAGVWKSLYWLLTCPRPSWLSARDTSVRQTLYEMVIETPTVVRSIHSDYYVDIVDKLLREFEEQPANTAELKVVEATIRFLKAEYDLAQASEIHGWKVKEPTLDPSQATASRTLRQEQKAISHAVKAIAIWTQVEKDLDKMEATPILSHALQTAQVFVEQFLHLDRLDHGLQLAYVCCRVAGHINDNVAYIRCAGAILRYSSQSIEGLEREAILRCMQLGDSGALDDVMCFVCDLAIHHALRGLVAVTARLVEATQLRFLKATKECPELNLELATGCLMEAENCLLPLRSHASLSSAINTHRHYLAVTNPETRWALRRLRALHIRRAASTAGLRAAGLSAPRRARASAACALPAASASHQAKLFAMITNTHAMDDAKKHIDYRIKHILGVPPSSHQPCIPSTTKNNPIFTPKQELETMLENCVKKSTVSPIKLPIPGFTTPDFLKHDQKCTCFNCDNPNSTIIILQTMVLEASSYFRAKEFEIARNYYNGCFESILLTEEKLNHWRNNINDDYNQSIMDSIKKDLVKQLKEITVKILIENSYFELSQRNLSNTDGNIIRIHEIRQEYGPMDANLQKEIENLLISVMRVRKQVKKRNVSDLRVDLLETPIIYDTTDPPKTPDIKAEKPPKITKHKVKDEEIPKTRPKIIGFSLDEDVEEPVQKPKTRAKKSQFKIPAPITVIPVPESVTPRNTRAQGSEKTRAESARVKPLIIVTPAEPLTPKPNNDKTEFFTPLQTPSEQFFTPMTSVKTYTKKSLRHNIVKNLEQEFFTSEAMKTKIDETPTMKVKKSDLDTEKAKTKKDKPDMDSQVGLKTKKTDLDTENGKTKKDKPDLDTQVTLKTKKTDLDKENTQTKKEIGASVKNLRRVGKLAREESKLRPPKKYGTRNTNDTP